MITFGKQILNLVEGQGINTQTKEYFPQGKWMTSPYFQNQPYEQFYRNLTTFFLLIEKQKNPPISNQQSQVSLSKLFNDQLNQREFKLKNLEVQMSSAASRLQLCMRVYLISSNIAYSYGNKDHQKVKIIIIQQSEPNLSFIFGLQNQIIHSKSCSNLTNILNLKKPELKQNIQNIQQQESVSPNNRQNLGQQRYLQNQNFQMKIQQFGNHQPNHAQQVLQQNPQTQLQEMNQNQPPQVNEEASELLTTYEVSEISIKSVAQPPKPKFIYSITKYQQNMQIQCDTCQELYQKSPEQQISLPCCRKIVHKRCMVQELETNEEILSNMKCKFCKKVFERDFLIQNVRPEIFDQTINRLEYLEECPICFQKLIIFPCQEKQPVRLECKSCNTSICTRCMQGFHESDKLEHPNTAFRRFQRQPTLCCTIRTSAQLNENGTDQITSNQNKIDLVSVNRRSIQSVGNVQNRQKTIIQERTTKNQSSIPNELESNKNGF